MSHPTASARKRRLEKKGVARTQAAEETLAAEEARERAEALADMAVEAESRLESMTLLLAELQNDSVSLADLQQKVLHGEVYLSRCQSLLDSVEQSIVELDPTTLKATTDA